MVSNETPTESSELLKIEQKLLPLLENLKNTLYELTRIDTDDRIGTRDLEKSVNRFLSAYDVAKQKRSSNIAKTSDGLRQRTLF